MKKKRKNIVRNEGIVNNQDQSEHWNGQTFKGNSVFNVIWRSKGACCSNDFLFYSEGGKEGREGERETRLEISKSFLSLLALFSPQPQKRSKCDLLNHSHLSSLILSLPLSFTQRTKIFSYFFVSIQAHTFLFLFFILFQALSLSMFV